MQAEPIAERRVAIASRSRLVAPMRSVACSAAESAMLHASVDLLRLRSHGNTARKPSPMKLRISPPASATIPAVASKKELRLSM